MIRLHTMQMATIDGVITALRKRRPGLAPEVGAERPGPSDAGGGASGITWLGVAVAGDGAYRRDPGTMLSGALLAGLGMLAGRFGV